MAFAGLTQRSLVVSNVLRYPLQGGMQFRRLAVPPLDDIAETGRGHTSPHRRRHTAHPTDEDCSIGADLLVASIRPACDDLHQSNQ